MHGCGHHNNPDDNKDYGLSTYNFHRDGSGVAYSSHLRPLLTWRPDFLTFHDQAGSGLRHLPGWFTFQVSSTIVMGPNFPCWIKSAAAL